MAGKRLDLRTGVTAHNGPLWTISGGYIDAGTNTVSVSVHAAGSGHFRATGIKINLVRIDRNGNMMPTVTVAQMWQSDAVMSDPENVNHTKNYGYNFADLYQDFGNTINVSFSGVKRCYLTMRCYINDVPKADGSGGYYSCVCNDASHGNANTDPGWKIDYSELEVGEPPTLNYLINKAPFTYMDRTKDDVSSYIDKIVLSWSGSWGDPADDSHIYYRVNDGSIVDAGHVDPFTISGLSPGVTYKIDAYVQNSIGATGWKSISIRTMYEIPNVTHTITPDLEEFIISWVSNRPLESLTCDVYEILDQSTKPSKKKRIITHDVPITSGDTSGTFKTCDLPPYPEKEGNCVLKPKTLYEVLVYGIATWEYDCRDFTLTHPDLYTLDRSHITAVSACTFGLPIDITIEGESEKHHKLKIWTEGNDLLPTFVFDDLEKGVYTFNPTQEQLDKIYRSIPNTGNIVPIHFLVTTHGDHLDYDDQQVDKTMTLTGIAKTAHVGDASNNPRRCQVWIGDANNNPRRVVMWVGDGSGNPRRTI